MPSIVCKLCGFEMVLDDCDFNFKGNKDNYWICQNCGTSAVEKIRYGESVNIRYNFPDVKLEVKKGGGDDD